MVKFRRVAREQEFDIVISWLTKIVVLGETSLTILSICCSVLTNTNSFLGKPPLHEQKMGPAHSINSKYDYAES